MSISNNNMTHIIHSRNLFIDTSTGSGKGDEFNLELGANQISASDGQFLRLTLVSFNMYNNIYPVNETNNQFRVVSRYGPASDVSQFLGISTLNSITPKRIKAVEKSPLLSRKVCRHKFKQTHELQQEIIQSQPLCRGSQQQTCSHQPGKLLGKTVIGYCNSK